jgi:hypothetical protein
VSLPSSIFVYNGVLDPLRWQMMRLEFKIVRQASPHRIKCTSNISRLPL